MKVLYYVGGISISETFILELAKRLNTLTDLSLVSETELFYKDELACQILSNKIPFRLDYYLNYFLESRGKKINHNIKQKMASKKVKPFLDNCDTVYIEYGTNAVRILPALIASKKPFTVHFHGYDITSQLNDNSYKKDLQKLFKYVSYVIAASHHIKRLLVLNGCPEHKIKVIRLGVTMPKIELKEFTNKAIDFISIGRLTSKKNPLALIEAFNLVLKKFPKSNLNLVGNGPLYSDCLARIKTLGIADCVKMNGAIKHTDAMKLLTDAKIYVQHSVTSNNGDQEGFAISLAEAALLEIPVVSTLHNGIPENVIDGETGYLVREFDYETMAEKMMCLLSNPDLAIRMGKQGKTHIESICNSEERAEKILNLLKNTIKTD
ncbi:glycosyltransferase [Winogradskyella arenosi]|uniref:Glycosyltransferase involved in cell wall biosynthesis n=1 Tax=Winogradskyella arenosi TaxID=533325 RepID=A0A368ZBS4_9FLAO|nr:glycosyltransferase [Winogradskyella arenosi]RCW90259.1 glycosyltransferase involved in cell wall biosynthesis [Winogradskyella arenosi]